METTISTKEAAELLNMDQVTLRVCLQNNLFPQFGTCIEIPGRKRKMYRIFRQKLLDYIGVLDANS